MTARYKLEPSRSRFSVQAFATGMLSMFAHSPLFTVREFSGTIDFPQDAIRSMRLELIVKANSLALTSNVNAVERLEIENRMRTEVLETASYPRIELHAGAVSAETVTPGQHRLEIGGSLSLHGVTQPIRAAGELQVYEDGVRLSGEFHLRLSDYRIQPVTALGGAIKLKDDLKLSFDLAALAEAS